MSKSVVNRGREDGFETLTLSNDALSLTVVPELGAKLISLLDRRSGREWLWRSGKTPQLFSVPTGAGFDEGPLLGADECIPTVAACRWRGRDLPDHGEAWTEPWTVDEPALERGELITRLELTSAPLTLTRHIQLDGATVHLRYTLENRSDEPVEYLWALHPMLALRQGDRLVLPEAVKQVRTFLTLGSLDLGERGATHRWPNPIPGVEFSEIELGGEGRAAKVFTEPLPPGACEASLDNPAAGDRLTLRFDATQLNTLGVWLNRGGFGGYEHVAIEPTNGAPDPLDVAVEQWQRASTLAPRASQQWQLQLISSAR